jgi:hypothetical protein
MNQLKQVSILFGSFDTNLLLCRTSIQFLRYAPKSLGKEVPRRGLSRHDNLLQTLK